MGDRCRCFTPSAIAYNRNWEIAVVTPPTAERNVDIGGIRACRASFDGLSQDGLSQNWLWQDGLLQN
jgi:hypothetical protein